VGGVDATCQVGGIEALAHPCKPARRLFEIAATWPDSLGESVPRASSPCRTSRPVSSSVVDELVAGYQAGTSVPKLAAQFGINRETVGKHLKARGINTREPKISRGQVQEAAMLYRDGWSLARLGARFGVDDGTMRSRLMEVGVVMRPRKGGRQRDQQ
jgi:hypothetical protein